MTAISTLYDPGNGKFVIASDGRCNAFIDTGETIVASDHTQKIFHTRGLHFHVAYAISGVSGTVDGSFNTMIEAAKHIRTLATRRFKNAQKFTDEVCSKMKKSIHRWVKSGTFPTIPNQEELHPEEAGRILRLFVVGYYHSKPFGVQARFYVDWETNEVNARRNDFELSQHHVCCSGSQIISDMVYGRSPVDPRIAKHKYREGASILEAATSYIKACSDPAAVQIDPDCSTIGGHIHAAEITPSGFRWLIEPA